MADYKPVLGGIAVIVGFAAFAPYILDMLRGKTKPHAFSWLGWGIIETVAFFAQINKGGGAGAWATVSSAVIIFFIAGYAFFKKQTTIYKTDWAALGGALLGILLWLITRDPLLAVILVSVSDALAFVPTFRKSYFLPEQETLKEYGLSAVKWTLAILALSNYSLTTWLYPASLIFTNSLFVAMTLTRRKQSAVFSKILN